MKRQVTPQRRVAFKIMKAARGRWLTRREICDITSVCPQSAWNCAQDMLEEGVLLERDGPNTRGGIPPKLYTVAPAWLGPDLP